MAFLDEKTREQVREALAPLTNDVELVVFTAGKLVVPGRDEPGQQRETLALLREVAELNDKIDVVERPLATDEEANSLRLTVAPTILLREKGSDRSNIRFLGLPSGYEFSTLIQTLLMLGTGESGLGEASKEKLTEVTTPVTVQSFVTPTCPYCPQAVLTAFRFAYHNPNVIGVGVEANEFPTLAGRYRISGVPDTVFEGGSNERVLGGQPERVFTEALLKAAGAAAPAAD